MISGHAATIVDFGVIESGILERSTEDIARNIAFSRLVLETIIGVPREETDDHITDGGDDRGIDFIYIDHDKKNIVIASCKTVAAFKNSRKNFPGDEIDKIISFVDDVLYRRESIFQSCNGKLAAKIREIWDVFTEQSYTIEVYLFSNQLTLAKDARERLVCALERHRIGLSEFGLYELSHGVVKSSKPRFRKTLNHSTESVLSIVADGRRALVVSVDLASLVPFLTLDNAFDHRLIWQNVRYFLGLDNDVNREIKTSLIAGNPSDFWFLNSGLTIVCDQIISHANGSHPITMVNPQIVNGCQTATVIHEVATQTLSQVPDAKIQVRVIETRDPEFVERVALASNTQSRILARDLRANEEFQKKIAECLRSYGYQYLRKRGDVQKAGLQAIDAARAGQLMLAYVCGEPTKSKTNSNEIFGDLYDEAFNKHAVTPEKIIAAHECYAVIEKRRREALAWQASIARNSFEETWIIEGHFHVLFVVGELMKRQRLPLEDREISKSLVDTACGIIADFVAANKNVASYRLFRLSRSRDQILSFMESSAAAPSNAGQQYEFDYS